MPSSPGPPSYLVCPDSFKGTFSARQVAVAIAEGLRTAGARADLCPIADGGEGTAETVGFALGGEARAAAVSDPLGRAIEATFVLVEEGRTAVIDTAAASGLTLLSPSERDAAAAGTYGTGELIAAAVDAGAARVLLAAGGSATTDGGRGAIDALRDRGGLRGASLEVLCDVETPFERAARVFAPQKGADAALVARLEQRLDALARSFRRDPRGVPMTGCAGGLSGGLWSEFDARLRSGADFVLDLLRFDARLRSADAAITGEGRIDSQSLEGKAVGRVWARCAAAGRGLHVLVGRNDLGPEAVDALPTVSIQEAGTLDALREAARRLVS